MEERETTHYAMIIGSGPPRATVIAHGPKEFCRTALIDWVAKHPLEDDEHVQLLMKDN